MPSWGCRAARVAAGLAALHGATALPASAQEAAPLIPGGAEIIEVRLKHADSMAVTQTAGEPQVFQGHVDIVVVDRDRNESRLQAAKVTIFRQEGARQFDRLIAEGGVVMTRDDLVAKTELAVYDGAQNTVDLLQDNFVQDGRGELTADRIRVHLQTNQVSAEGNVRGVVYPERVDAEADGA